MTCLSLFSACQTRTGVALAQSRGRSVDNLLRSGMEHGKQGSNRKKEESPGSGYTEDPTGCSNLRWQMGSLHWRTILASGWRPPLKAEISCECPPTSFTTSDVLVLLLIARNTDMFKHRGLADEKPPAAQATKKSTEKRLKVHTAKGNSFTGVLDHWWQKYNPTVP